MLYSTDGILSSETQTQGNNPTSGGGTLATTTISTLANSSVSNTSGESTVSAYVTTDVYDVAAYNVSVVEEFWECIECRTSLLVGICLAAGIFVCLFFLLWYACRHWCVEYPDTKGSCSTCCTRTDSGSKSGLHNNGYVADEPLSGKSKYQITRTQAIINESYM